MATGKDPVAEGTSVRSGATAATTGPAARVPGAEIAAIVLSGLWLLGMTLFFILAGTGVEGALGVVLAALVVALPVAMIWVAVMVARTARIMREESARLHVAVEAIRRIHVSQNRAQGGEGAPAAGKGDGDAAAQRKSETALSTFSSSRPLPSVMPKPRPAAARSAPANNDAQKALPLGTPPEGMHPPLERADFIRALNFPETAEDKAGFAALRRALKDRPTAKLIQAAQDVLTLLSQDGIYMDDLSPDMARPEIWRNFAGGTRGRAIAALGGIRDRSALALASARMKNDPIFRDAAHHFLRRFDQMFSTFAEEAEDRDISDLSDTRTARAFMLLGRVAGTFD